MELVLRWWNWKIKWLDRFGEFLPQLALRFLLAWEFWGSGVMKWQGDNWFPQIQDQFPFPFNLIPANVSWYLAMWTELLGPLALVLGLGTRFWAFAMLVVDVVAWVSVHADNGYNVCNNGYKLALFYAVLLLPLLFRGPGRASLDFLIRRRFGPRA